MSQGLYRDIILEHSRNPRNSGRLDHPTHAGRASNPVCGDELELTLDLAGGRVHAIRAAVRGCVISQAASSLMTLAVEGAERERLLAMAAEFRLALDGKVDTLSPPLASLAPLLELRQHRSRIGCALLPWSALERALG